MKARRPPYRAYAQNMYRMYAWGLAALSRCRPLFRLALRVLTSEPQPVRGRILPLNKPLGSPEQVPLARGVLEELIGKSAGVALMRECLCRSVGGCGEYPKDLGCLVLGEAARAVHPALGWQATGAEALERVDRALRLGLVPTVMRMRCDSLLWSLDGAKLLTVCFCCPCHCLMRQAAGTRSKSFLAGLPGIAVRFDREKCAGCGRCERACFKGAVALRAGVPRVNREKCLACGRCAAACPTGALEVKAGEGCSAGVLADDFVLPRTKENG